MAAGYLAVQSSPVRVKSCYAAAVDARGHAIAVEFYFVKPLMPRWRRRDQLGKLRRDEGRERRASLRQAGLGGLRDGMLDDAGHGTNVT
jgi:hypothetical protein